MPDELASLEFQPDYGQEAEAGVGGMIFLYGPPGSGKSLAGRLLAEDLELPFTDLDRQIESASGESIAEIFTRHGEAEFRRRERELLSDLLEGSSGVISLGGGSLLDPESRAKVERRGRVVCLTAPLDVILERLAGDQGQRPLLVGDLEQRLRELLDRRSAHYDSFALHLDSSGLSLQEMGWEIQIRLGAFHVRGMGQGYDVRVQSGAVDRLGEMLAARDLRSPVVVVSDEQVASFYGVRAMHAVRSAGLEAHLVALRPGEQHKHLASVERLWKEFTAVGVERSSSVVALGGGVVGDLAGFAAATYLRGVAWVGAPTSLLAMVDASLGGKTGFDLPSGKNLVGAFHPPRLVLSDPQVLGTLPEPELRSGMAEVVKHGIIADPRLFEVCAGGWQTVKGNLDEIVRRAAAVKVRVIQVDPFEQNERAALNLGHTLGHAIEHASGYRLRHGEAVAIGMVAAATLSERMGIAESGLAGAIAEVLRGLGLPTQVPPGLPREQVLQAMGVDKKRLGGVVRLVLPVKIGEVRTGVVVDDVGMLLDL